MLGKNAWLLRPLGFRVCQRLDAALRRERDEMAMRHEELMQELHVFLGEIQGLAASDGLVWGTQMMDIKCHMKSWNRINIHSNGMYSM